MTRQRLPFLAISFAVIVSGCGRFDPQPPPLVLPSARMDPTAAALAGSRLPPTVATPLDGDAMGVEIHRLSNGLTVYISTDRQTPRISAWVAVRSGSRHDPARSTGLAHYLEHMLFKGTSALGTIDHEAERPHLERIAALYDELRETEDDARRAEILSEVDAETQESARYAIPNEFDRLYKELGIRGVNAFTDDEVTCYIADVPSNRFEAWAMVEAQRYTDPVFRLFMPELEAVYEEKNRALDSPGRRMRETLMNGLFPQHPYGTQPTLGRVEHLKSPAYGDMIEYFRRWYVPNNMAIILAGDIDAPTALPVLGRLFGDWQPRPFGAPEPGALPAVESRVELEIRAEGEESLLMAWRTVPIGHRDEQALTVLDWLMDNAKSGLLNLQLEVTGKLPDAGSYPSNSNDAGLWAMRASIRQDQTLEEAEEMLLGVLDDLKGGAIAQADIDAIVVHEEIRQKRQLESNGGRVGEMLGAFIAYQPWREVLAQRQALRDVTRDDVLRVARQYLGDDYVIVLRREGKPDLPNIEKPTITPVAIDTTRSSPFADSILALEAPVIEPDWVVEGEDYERVELDAGMMIATRNERNDLFSLSYVIERGYRTEPLLCYALTLLDRSGAGDLSAEALRRKLYALGTSISTSCGESSSGIAVSGIDRHMEESVRLLRLWFAEPRFDDETIEPLLANTLAARRDATEDPRALSGALRAFAWYDDESSYLRLPANDVLIGATSDELSALIRSFPNHAHRVVYFGPRRAADAAAVSALGQEHAPVAARDPTRFRRTDATRIYFLHKDVAKADVAIAVPHGPLARAERPVSIAYGEYVGGGMDSLIFQEIREARGLAYSAWGTYMDGSRPTDESGFVGVMQTQVDKVPEALTAYLELIKDRPLDPRRLRSSITALDQGYRTTRLSPRGTPGQILAWDDKGESEDPRAWEWQAIRAMEPDVAAAFADKAGDGEVIIAVIGDRARLDMEALEAIAPIVDVTAQELFSYGAFPQGE